MPDRRSVRFFVSGPPGSSATCRIASAGNSRVPLPALGAPTVGACRKDVGEIDLRGASEPKPRHPALTRALCRGSRQPFEIPFEIRIIDLGDIAALKRIRASLDLRAEGVELEAFSHRHSQRRRRGGFAGSSSPGRGGLPLPARLST